MSGPPTHSISLGKGSGPPTHSARLGKGSGRSPSPPPLPPPASSASVRGKGSQRSHQYDLDRTWNVGGVEARFCDEEEFIRKLSSLDYSGKKPQSMSDFNSMLRFQQEGILQALAQWHECYRFRHNKMTPLPREVVSDYVDWSTCVGVERSSTGSEGILFVELEGSRAVCVKCPKFVAAEVFGSKLCQRMGIRCPEVRPVQRDSAEGLLLKEKLWEVNEKLENCSKVREILNNMLPIYMVVEYLPGKELSDMIPPVCNEWTESTFGLRPAGTSSQNEPSEGALSDAGRKVLQLLGSIVAFDILINNFDRFPVVWDNTGNPGNVMFCGEGEGFSIDNVPNCTNMENPLFGVYRQRVLALVASVTQAPDEEHQAFKIVRNMLKTGSKGQGWGGLGMDVGAEGTVEIQRGFLETVQRVIPPEDDGVGPSAERKDSGRRGGPLTREVLESMLEDLYDLVPDEEEERVHGGLGFGVINLDFLNEILSTFAEGSRGQPGLHRKDPDTAVAEPSYENIQMKLPEGAQTLNLNALERRQAMDYECDGSHLRWTISNEEMQRNVSDVREKQRAKMRLLGLMRSCSTLKTSLTRVRRRPAGGEQPTIQDAVEEEDDEAEVVEAKVEAEAVSMSTPAASAEKEAQPQHYLPLDKLACLGPWPEDVHPAHRENWLSPEDFEEVFRMSRDSFLHLKDWQRRKLKMDNLLF